MVHSPAVNGTRKDLNKADSNGSNIESEDVTSLTDAEAFEPPPAFGHDDGVWEDVPDHNLAETNQRPPYSSPSSNGSQRSNFASSFKQKNIKEDIQPLIHVDSEKIRDAFTTGASNTFEYATDVVRHAFWVLRKPFGILLALWILALLLTKLSSAFRTVFYPICYIPGFTRSPWCQSPLDLKNVPQWADFPRLMDVQGSTFEQLLDESVGSAGLSLEIKKAEMATSDLVTLVKVSDLKSRELLARSLEDFVGDARKSGRGLQKLSSKIGGAVDTILAVNDHALNTIKAHEAKSRGLIARFSPLSSTSKQLITKTFDDAMTILSSSMQRIVLEAQVSMSNLDNLEQRLTTLHEIIIRENGSISAEREQLLADLWTFLGGNKRKVRGLDGHLFLLRNIGEYRTKALAHVSAAMHALEGMSEDMEDLRERVAAPDIAGDRIPVEVHMKSIKAGLDRLTEQRYRARIREEENIQRFLGQD